jgi:hypothetical protein
MTQQEVAVLVEATAEVLRNKLAPLHDRITALEQQLAEVRTKSVRYDGVWKAGTIYETNTMVTHDGGLWCCLETHASNAFSHRCFRLMHKTRERK